MPRHLLLTGAFSLASLSLASAQVPAGGEFQVNVFTTSGQWTFSRSPVALDGDGNFVVVWEGNGQDGSSYGAFGRRFDATGAALGGEFQVNTYTTGYQGIASVAFRGRRGFVVVWEDRSGQSGGELSDVFARLYDAGGAPVGDPFRVNTFVALDQAQPSVASDALGNFVVAWGSDAQDGSLTAVVAQRFDATGAPRGSEFVVNTYTTSAQSGPFVASHPDGRFVVAWTSHRGGAANNDIAARAFDAAGQPVGAEFAVNTYTTEAQYSPSVAMTRDGAFVVAWASNGQDGDGYGIFSRQLLADGTGGPEVLVNLATAGNQLWPRVASDADGDFVVVWNGQDGLSYGALGRRFDVTGFPRGGEFQVNTFTTGSQRYSGVVSDEVGNLIVAWSSPQDGSSSAAMAQRFGGLRPAALEVDAAGTRVLEPGETADVAPAWRNVNGAAQTFGGFAFGFSGPAAAGVTYGLPDAGAAYGSVPDGAVAACSDCYQVSVGFAGTRPSLHWDAMLIERLVPDAQGQTKRWTVHVGNSFPDVPSTSVFYRFVETLLHRGATGGCGSGLFCPADATTRGAMAVFVLLAKEGAGYAPPPCGAAPFPDVPPSHPFCPFIAEVSRRGVVAGCGGGNYCPGQPVLRDQMAVFALATLDPTFTPPPCGSTPRFPDVPASSPFCPFVEELARRGVVTGCGGGNYCPGSPVTRQEMAVFATAVFGLTLYGP